MTRLPLVSFSVLFFCAVVQAAHGPHGASAQPPSYTLFESDPVSPLALSPDASRVFTVNTADGYLEIWEFNELDQPILQASVPVGLEPVSVAARTNSEVWVVNHVSDSVSIVDVSVDPPRVVRTLLVGDEPRDIVFAGPGRNRAFVTTAHRGQNSPYPDGEYDVPGVGRADVWVFDTANLGTTLGGTPETIITLFGDRPRALAATPDGSTVYAAVYRSGNQTAAISEGLVCDGAGPCDIQGTTYPGGRPPPETNFQGVTSRETGLIVGFNTVTGIWEDELGRDWSDAVRFSLPDLDVFRINANANPPVETGAVSGVGTILFNMIVNPVNGNVYVTNTEANNRVRFEGFGDYVNDIGPKPSGDPASVRGHLHEARITIVEPSLNVRPRHLNKHIPYDVSPVPEGVKEKSVATPLQMAISSDGTTLYVVGFSSNTVTKYETAQLENDTFEPSLSNTAGIKGASGIVLDESRNLLLVTSRQTNRLFTLDATTLQLLTTSSMHNPEPGEIISGRKFLYDATLTSSNGEASCSSCHVFGDMDDLPWDLGDPDGVPFANPNPGPAADQFPLLDFLPALQPFDPLKGPMTTQSLRGLADHGPMHWRGDRTGGSSGGDPLDENAAFLAFNVAFPGLLGRDEGELTAAEMQAFATFAMRLTYPPNPIRPLDNSLSLDAEAGLALYTGPISDQVANCNGCHVLDRSRGFFGSSGGSTFENEAMEFKVPHLRNAYQKVGMFGEAPTNFFPNADGSFMGDQVRASGFLHDGSVSTVFNFLGASVFSLNETLQRQLEAFIMEFDSNLAPIVGQQVTLSDASGSDVLARVDLLISRADAIYYVTVNDVPVEECDLIVKGVVNGESRGWLYNGNDTFQSDRAAEAPWTKSELLAAASNPGQPLTFTCSPPGSGRRMGLDRDGDGLLNADDPTPSAGPTGGGGRTSWRCSLSPAAPASLLVELLFLLGVGILGRLIVIGRGRRRRRAR